MKRRYLILAGVLAFLIALVLNAPAATLYGWLAPKEIPPAASLSGIGGTVFSGQAGALQVRGRPTLNGVAWTLQPLSLLWGRATYRLQSSDPQLLLDARVGKGLGGTRVRDLKLNGSVRALLTAFGQPFVPVDGQLGLDLERLDLDAYWPTSAEGELRIANLAWTLARDPVALGDFEAVLKRDGKDLTALVTTVSGPLDLDGDARLYPDRRYELHLQLKPKADAPPMVVNLVRSLGPADAQGYHHLRRQGQFPGAAAGPSAGTATPALVPAPTRLPTP